MSTDTVNTDTTREPRVLTGVRLLVEISSAIILFAIMLYTVANVISRVVAGTPLPAVIELITRWWLVPLVFGGWLIAHLADEHIRVDFIIERADGVVDLLYRFLNKGLLLLFLGIIAYGGWIGATENRMRQEHGIDTGAPVWITRYAIPILTALFLGVVVYEIAKLIVDVLRRRTRPVPDPDPARASRTATDAPEGRQTDRTEAHTHPQNDTTTGADHDHA
ncbi:MAG TPA: TRAP transporter small permease [Brevibacterium sp.]|nr:TRAP transporter small permease [Brevibacterium sp.]